MSFQVVPDRNYQHVKKGIICETLNEPSDFNFKRDVFPNVTYLDRGSLLNNSFE